MQSRRALNYIPWLAGLLFLIVFIPTLFQRSFRQDLDILLIASERLYRGLPVYIEGINPHTKPPFLGMLLWPLTLLSKPLLFRIWDLLNFLCFFGLAVSFARYFLAKTALKTSVSFLVLFCLNELGGEVRYGQYNLIAYGLMYFLFFSKRYALWGVASVFVTLLKPVNALFFLWGLLAAKTHRLPVLISAVSTGLLLGVAYAVLFGWSSLVRDHQKWLAFVEGPIADQWMGTLDGLATWLFQMGLGTPTMINRWVGALAIGLTFAVTRSFRDDRISFCLVGVLTAILNPIPFKHNYIVLLGFYAWCFKIFLDPKTRTQKNILLVGFLFTYFSFQIYSPTTFHWAIWNTLRPNTYGFYSTLVLMLGASFPFFRMKAPEGLNT